MMCTEQQCSTNTRIKKNNKTIVVLYLQCVKMQSRVHITLSNEDNQYRRQLVKQEIMTKPLLNLSANSAVNKSVLSN